MIDPARLVDVLRREPATTTTAEPPELLEDVDGRPLAVGPSPRTWVHIGPVVLTGFEWQTIARHLLSELDGTPTRETTPIRPSDETGRLDAPTLLGLARAEGTPIRWHVPAELLEDVDGRPIGATFPRHETHPLTLSITADEWETLTRHLLTLTTTTEDTPMSTDTTDPTDHDITAPEPEDTREGQGSNREAARYRTRLRETEAELQAAREQLDGHAGTVERLQRALVEREAAAMLRDPADLWRYAEDVKVSDLMGEDGAPDPEKLRELVDTVTAERDYLARPRTPKPDHTQGQSHQPMRPADPVGSFLAERLG